MSENPVLYELIDGIAILTLNNPRRRNALSLAVLASLKAHLDTIKENPSVRVVVVRSQGPIFSSGYDLTEMAGREKAGYTHLFAAFAEVMEAIRSLPKPVIAQVQGLATAAGCELAVTCDLAVASETASFATPGVLMGMFCTTPAVAVSRAVPPKKAMEMLLTGTPIPAREALESGLINRVVPEGQAYVAALEFAKRLAAGAPLAIKWTKLAIKQALKEQVNLSYEMALALEYLSLLSDDQQEGALSFLEKRAPVFHGR